MGIGGGGALGRLLGDLREAFGLLGHTPAGLAAPHRQGPQCFAEIGPCLEEEPAAFTVKPCRHQRQSPQREGQRQARSSDGREGDAERRDEGPRGCQQVPDPNLFPVDDRRRGGGVVVGSGAASRFLDGPRGCHQRLHDVVKLPHQPAAREPLDRPGRHPVGHAVGPNQVVGRKPSFPRQFDQPFPWHRSQPSAVAGVVPAVAHLLRPPHCSGLRHGAAKGNNAAPRIPPVRCGKGGPPRRGGGKSRMTRGGSGFPGPCLRHSRT